MATMPRTSSVSGIDIARDWLRQQNARRQSEQASRDRFASRSAELETEALRAGAKKEAEGASNLVTARRYKEEGIPAPASIAGKTHSTVGVKGTKAASAFMQGLRDGGLTNPIGLSAAMGHAQIESGFDPTAVGDAGKAYGGFQWNDRQPNMRKWIKEQGEDPADPYWQGRFGAHEMETSEKGPGDRLKNARSLGEANEAMVSFLRPQGAEKGIRGVIHGRERAGASDAWYRKLTSTKPEEAAPQQAAGTQGVELDIGGRKVRGNYLKPSDASNIVNNNPDLFGKLVAYPSVTDAKGRVFYEDKSLSATPAALPNPTPGTQAPPVNAEPAPVPPSPATVAIEDDDDDDEFNPRTGA